MTTSNIERRFELFSMRQRRWIMTRVLRNGIQGPKTYPPKSYRRSTPIRPTGRRQQSSLHPVQHSNYVDPYLGDDFYA